MELEERAEELLETLWLLTEENKGDYLSLDDPKDKIKQETIEQLLEAGYISLADSKVRLTDKGRPIARNVVRRHRLAERLLADVLGAKDMLMHEKACKFEHLLDRGLDESICSLLGHPKVCPHGKAIPPGKCCQKEQTQGPRLVSPLSQLVQGQKGKVAYIYAPEASKLQKLMAMGILPGAPVSLIQSFPSYAFQVGQTQFAVDKEIADAIYIRRVDGENTETGEKLPPRRVNGGVGNLARRFRKRWLRGG